MALSAGFIPTKDLNPFRVSIQDKFTTDELEKIMEEHNTLCCSPFILEEETNKRFDIPLNVQLLKTTEENIFRFELRKEALLLAELAINEKKPVNLLTNMEKLGILFAAGVPFHTILRDELDNYTCETYNKVEIILQDGIYWVTRRQVSPATY